MKHAIPSTTQKRLSMAIIRQHETLMHIPSGKPPQIPDDFTKTRHSSGNKPQIPDNYTNLSFSSGNKPQIPDDFAKTRHSSGNKPRNPDNYTNLSFSSGNKAQIPDELTCFCNLRVQFRQNFIIQTKKPTKLLSACTELKA